MSSHAEFVTIDSLDVARMLRLPKEESPLRPMELLRLRMILTQHVRTRTAMNGRHASTAHRAIASARTQKALFDIGESSKHMRVFN